MNTEGKLVGLVQITLSTGKLVGQSVDQRGVIRVRGGRGGGAAYAGQHAVTESNTLPAQAKYANSHTPMCRVVTATPFMQAVLAGEKLAPALLHLGVDSSSSQPDAAAVAAGAAADDVGAGPALEEQ